MRERKLPPGTYQEPTSEESFAWTAFDRAMTEALYRQHAPFVAGFLARLGVASRHIDEEVLRVFAEVHRRSGCTPGGASMKAWVAGIALQSAVRRYHLGKVELPPPSVDGSSDPSIEEFLFSLDPELRAIFVLFELEGEPSEAIASAFGLTLERVHARLHEGQREFRRAFTCDAPAPSVDDEALVLPAFVDPVSLV
jgi:RNA polymerase sigma-70 factor (ECF subfamily)